MRILVNGAWHETPAVVLAEALEQFGYAESVVCTAVNGEFVPVSARLATQLREGDSLEVLAPMQGG
jgi:sulfur carrier protein